MADPAPTKQIHDAHVARDGGASFANREVTTDLGTVSMLVCTTCHFIDEVECLHTTNTWFDVDGKLAATLVGAHTLRCDFCGLDVT